MPKSGQGKRARETFPSPWSRSASSCIELHVSASMSSGPTGSARAPGGALTVTHCPVSTTQRFEARAIYTAFSCHAFDAGEETFRNPAAVSVLVSSTWSHQQLQHESYSTPRCDMWHIPSPETIGCSCKDAALSALLP